jgi:hypothetical protein
MCDLFYRMCVSLGVPEELLDKHSEHIRVSATRSLGAGSTYAKLNNLMMARNAGLLNDMTEVGRRELSREIFSALAGYDSLDRFFSVDGAEVPSNESTIANLEVNDHAEGTSTIVGIDQNHNVHLSVHLAAMVQEAQAFQQDPLSADLERVFNLFQNGLPHAMRHLQILSGDPTRANKVAEYEQMVQQLMQFFQQVAPMVEQLQKQKEQEIQQLREQNQQLMQSTNKENMAHERELFKLQNMMEIERMKVEGLNESRFQKTSAQLQVQVERAGQGMAIQQQKHSQEMNERMAKLQMDMAEAQAKIQSLLAKAQVSQQER